MTGKYRVTCRGAPTRRVTLNRVGKITPDEARDLARKILGAVAHGIDFAATKAAERRAATLKELADLFLADHAEAKRKASTAAHYRDVLERLILPTLGTRKAETRSLPPCVPSRRPGRSGRDTLHCASRRRDAVSPGFCCCRNPVHHHLWRVRVVPPRELLCLRAKQP